LSGFFYVKKIAMKNKFQFPIFLLLTIFIALSCGDDCENTVLIVPEAVDEWLAYPEGNSSVSFIDSSMVNTSYTLRKDNDPLINAVGKDCTETIERPYIHLIDNEKDEIIYNLWYERSTSSLFGDATLIRGTYTVVDSLDNKTISNNGFSISDFNEIGDTINIGGVDYSEIYPFSFLKNGEITSTIFLQKNKGLIAFDVDGNLSILVE